jgi:hypothetical protein
VGIFWVAAIGNDARVARLEAAFLTRDSLGTSMSRPQLPTLHSNHSYTSVILFDTSHLSPV